MTTAVKITGAKELRKALRQLDDDLRKYGQGDLKSAFRTAARVVEIAARQEAPKRSGRLAGTVKAKGTTRGAAVTAGGTNRVPYAGPIHWGWPTRPNKAKGWRGGPIASNQFLTRAAHEQADVVRDVLADEIQKIADKFMSLVR